MMVEILNIFMHARLPRELKDYSTLHRDIMYHAPTTVVTMTTQLVMHLVGCDMLTL